MPIQKSALRGAPSSSSSKANKTLRFNKRCAVRKFTKHEGVDDTWLSMADMERIKLQTRAEIQIMRKIKSSPSLVTSRLELFAAKHMCERGIELLIGDERSDGRKFRRKMARDVVLIEQESQWARGYDIDPELISMMYADATLYSKNEAEKRARQYHRENIEEDDARDEPREFRNKRDSRISLTRKSLVQCLTQSTSLRNLLATAVY